MAKVTVNGSLVDTATFPPASIEALLSRGLSHLFGSELSSKIVGKIRAQAPEVDGKRVEWTKDEVRAWREANAEQIKTWTAEGADAIVKQLVEGTLGASRATGPRIDPLEERMWKIAEAYIDTHVLAANGIKKPARKDQAEPNIKIAGMALSYDDLVARRMVKVGEEVLRKQATKELAAEANARAKAKAAAEGAQSLEDLGL